MNYLKYLQVIYIRGYYTKEAELILIKTGDAIDKKASTFAENIITSMITSEEVDVVGLGTSIFLACSAVNIASSIANIHVHEISLEYIEIPILGRTEVMIFTLRKTPLVPDKKSSAAELDKNMNLTFESGGQLIVISSKQDINKLTTLCLWKLSRSSLIKLIAAGTAINNAVKTALTLSKGNISREKIDMKLLVVENIQGIQREQEKSTTGIMIYLEKGKETVTSPHHKKILESLQKPGFKAA